MRPRVHHPLTVPDLVEAWILDRLSVAPVEGDRPSLRFLASRDAAISEAFDLGDGLDPDGDAYLPGAVVAFERGWLASVARLVSPREDRSDLSEDEVELRTRADLPRWRGAAATILASDAELDHWREAWRGGHPEDDGTGRLTAAAIDAIDAIALDPRRIPIDETPLPPARGRR